MGSTLTENIKTVKKNLAKAAKKSGRPASDIILLGVTKQHPVGDIFAAMREGLDHFGENYVQEFLAKWEELKNYPLAWHFIGHLQRRKVKDIVGKALLIHTVDSYQVAVEIAKRAKEKKFIQKCLIQVNLAEEDTKTGLSSKDVFPLLQELAQEPHLEILGLMAIPPFKENPEEVRPFFKALRELKDSLNEQRVYPTYLTELSMGMSHDFEVAIEEGSTIVRIGTSIFGPRQ